MLSSITKRTSNLTRTRSSMCSHRAVTVDQVPHVVVRIGHILSLADYEQHRQQSTRLPLIRCLSVAGTRHFIICLWHRYASTTNHGSKFTDSFFFLGKLRYSVAHLVTRQVSSVIFMQGHFTSSRQVHAPACPSTHSCHHNRCAYSCSERRSFPVCTHDRADVDNLHVVNRWQQTSQPAALADSSPGA